MAAQRGAFPASDAQGPGHPEHVAAAADRSEPDADDEYRSLNRVRVDRLQRSLLAAGMIVTKLELITNATHIPRELAHMPLSLLGVGGVKVLAVPA